MSFEPEKFFIGVIDLFSVLLPGALLSYLLRDHVIEKFFGNGHPWSSPIEGWVVFLVSSYLIGHFIFLIGSWLLDERLYDPIRQATYGAQIRRLAKGGKISPGWARWLAKGLFKKGADQTASQAIALKEH